MIRYCRCAVLLVSALLPIHGLCAGWSFDDARPEWGRFALGLAGGVVAHELGHYAVATAKGYRVGHDGLSIVYPGAAFTDADHLQVASAGFQTQWLLAELVLRDSNGRESKEPPGNFGAGVVCAHLGITLAYLVYLKDHRQGDVVGMSDATGLSNNQLALALAVPGALDAWRLFGNEVPEWVPQLSLLGKGLGMAWTWAY
ncbi:MAG: site-2 protease family protein [Nitrosomonadales bacterium]|nr:site-2 protease family protein [Nitrosomonadales bacterium]